MRILLSESWLPVSKYLEKADWQRGRAQARPGHTSAAWLSSLVPSKTRTQPCAPPSAPLLCNAVSFNRCLFAPYSTVGVRAAAFGRVRTRSVLGVQAKFKKKKKEKEKPNQTRHSFQPPRLFCTRAERKGSNANVATQLFRPLFLPPPPRFF